MLLWLSHLTLTPFDLESISAPALGAARVLPTSFSPPQGLPTVASRLLASGLRYVSSASKERDAAVSLLVRLSLRPDMQRFQLHHRLIQWVFYSLDDLAKSHAAASIYFHTSILSYLAGFLRSGDGQIVASFLIPIFQKVEAIPTNSKNAAADILGSAVARKLVIKIYRSLAIHQLALTSATNPVMLIDVSQLEDSGQLDSIFDHLLTSLGDKDSPVRLTASKALSVIAQKLDPDMTVQIVDDIVQRLQETMDPSSWHGLILTLSHLHYRRSAPRSHLSTIIGLLVDALDFEQRSPMGVSLGGNVRDAACFGMWSVARKYSTAELLSLPILKSDPGGLDPQLNSIIKYLAAKLVLTATLDPEGNIRRGASAALQELVGRHPDMIPNGIQLIQIVDYHAVGLRSRAMNEVSIQAVELDSIYLDAIAVGILSWRAINSPAAGVRRDSACVLGHLVGKHGVHPKTLPMWQDSGTPGLPRNLQWRKEKSADEWHGIYLAHAAMIRKGLIENSSLVQQFDPPGHHVLLKADGMFGPKDIKAHGKGVDLAIEALCGMIAAVSDQTQPHVALSQLEYHMDILEACFKRCTAQNLNVVTTAAVSILRLLEEPEQWLLICRWLKNIQKGRNGQLQDGGSNVTLIAVVGAALEFMKTSAITHVAITLQIEALVSQTSKHSNIETKCAALNHLYLPVFNRAHTDFPHLLPHLQPPLLNSLADHTIDSRGDIGSEVRIAALSILSSTQTPSCASNTFQHEVFGLVYGLAVEKLDKVRACAWFCIRNVLNRAHGQLVDQ
ncbi:MAG: hypothetical protein Q9169_008313 [Polycauliona sp. 2 TL-2023]